jgi:small subunit ribosomal protein S5
MVQQATTKKEVRFDQRSPRRQDNAPADEFEQIVVETRRVTKVTKGAKRFRFSSVVVVGNKAGRVGVGIGKGSDPKQAIEKGAKVARAHLVDIVLHDTTIPHQIIWDYGAAKVMLKPAAKGTGVIAGSSVRAVVELAGIKDIRGKIIGSNNKVNNVYCTMQALQQLRDHRI